MKKWFVAAAAVVGLLLSVVLSSASAFAQQPQQSPNEQAMANKLMQEISGNLQCQAALITAQKELEELKKKNDKDKPNAPSVPPK